jgi:hypothetical protein
LWDYQNRSFGKEIYNQKPIAVAIEIKYDFSSGLAPSKLRGDLDKLRMYYASKTNFVGYALLFLPNCNKNEIRKDSADWLKEVYQSTGEHINSIIIAGFRNDLKLWKDGDKIAVSELWEKPR